MGRALIGTLIGMFAQPLRNASRAERLFARLAGYRFPKQLVADWAFKVGGFH
jgi:hypothetical protein